MTDLHNLEELKRACADAIKNAETRPEYKEWGQELLDFLRYVRDADEETRASTEFQRRIWEENPVASIGQGTISVEDAIQDGEFRKWLAEESLRQLPQATEERGAALDQLFTEIQDQVGRYTNKTPRLKSIASWLGFSPVISPRYRIQQDCTAFTGRCSAIEKVRARPVTFASC